VVSLAKRGLDDTNLSELLNSIPSRSIILMEDIDAAFTRTVTREAPIDPQVAVSGPPAQSTTSTVTLSGLLNAIDGVQAQQGRLLFATTNKYTALDPALVRPGRLDVHIEFKLATKWQAGELFKRFYPIDDVTLSPPPVPNDSNEVDAAEGDLSELSEKASVFSSVSSSDTHVELPDLMKTMTAGTNIHQAARSRHGKPPRLTPEQLRTLAQGFADCIPEEELSMASLQGHLMMHKTRPDEAVRTAPAFIIKQREARAKARTMAETAPVAPVIPASLIGPVAPVALVSTVTPVTPVTLISPLPSVSHPSLVLPTDDPSPALVPVVEATASL
jgi:mitochondrial chaperone BCS1